MRGVGSAAAMLLWLSASALAPGVWAEKCHSPAPSGSPVASAWVPLEGAELLGTEAPQWSGVRWIQGGPLSLDALRGKPVFLRLWSAGCPYCTRSAPALRELHQRYAGRGVVVIGLHHPNTEDSGDPDVIQRFVRELGFEFPIADDPDWTTVRAYGAGTRFTSYTSASFLIDAQGVIRFVHEGGDLHRSEEPEHARCNAAYLALLEAIEELLAGCGGEAR